ncbi:MAG: diguanylate cyclase/phosphodiesterase (GGDEF & EAL domains) with PAS/PAC sensor(s) [uncultured Rubellimicrobium sp.]|uniref:histidine kinase n=1 Tax=uncultured Rubellimicrobium sp. TaxID=543078 RepID=A0A6J4QCJ4_9RHOB|nr:MAG: diguanylate cyclase/phosphodiesterase (GGDEF & EAL domains) with PAS/PAC sensor(s) [uncultured Rubellimicrobium sp.]
MASPEAPASTQRPLGSASRAPARPKGRRIARDLLSGAAIALAYWAAVMLGLRWAVLPGFGTPVWPAAGIAFAGLVLGGSRLWPAVLLGRLAAAVTAGTPLALWADILVAVATMLGAYVPARALELMRRRLNPALGNIRDMAWLTLGGGLLGAVISAVLGVGAIWLGGTPADTLPYAGLNWWFGYLVGALTVAPLVLSWSAPGAFAMPVWQWGHLATCLGVVALVSGVVFLQEETPFLRTWHTLPLLVWAALAFNVRGMSVALCITSAFAIAGAVNGTGPLTSEGGAELVRVLLTQQFIAMTALTLLFLAAVAHERHDVEALGQLAAIVSSSPEAMVSLDRNGRVLSWNRGAEKLLGWYEAEAVGRPSSEVLPFEDQGRSAFDRVLGGRSIQEETVCLARDGTRIAVLLTQAPVRGPDGTVLGTACVIRDIRARKAAETALQRLNESLEQRVAERTRALEDANSALQAQIDAREAAEASLRQSQKMEAVGQLTGGIAHDFNNMLAVVIGSLDMAQRRATMLEPRVATLIENAMDGAHRAARLTSRLLALSRQQPLSPEPVDVNRLVGGMEELLARTIGELHPIETDLAPEPWPTFIDPSQLENAVLNLAVNARDAMPEGGHISIVTSNLSLSEAEAAALPDVAAGDYVVVRVADSGLGMEADVLDRVFDPFFTTKETGKGTGLGLSMVYGFVKQSGGHVRIESAVGRGTTVTLLLPRWAGALGAEEPPEATSSSGPPEVAAGVTVLVVEDEADVRRLSVRMLSDLGARVIEAEDAHDALDLLGRDERIRLLFTDVVMPGLGGPELARRAREIRPGLRVLATSGYTGEGAHRAGQLADLPLLPKPFTLDQLAAALQDALR